MWTHLWRDPRQVLEVAADAVGLLDDGVHAQLGDLVDERVLIALSVLHHCSGTAGAEQVKKSKEAKSRGIPQEAFCFIYPDLSCVCTR